MVAGERYEIRVEGHLDPSWQDWFESMALHHEPSGETLLNGIVEDQSALHGILARVRDLNLKLISVKRCERDGVPSGVFERERSEDQ